MRSKARLTVSPSREPLTLVFFPLADKNISSILHSDLKLTLVGQNGFKKRAFVNIFSKFKIHVENAGLYKLEIHHPKFYFEPVLVEILSE